MWTGIGRSRTRPKLSCLIYLLFIILESAESLVLRAYLSQRGLHGEIEFSYKNETFINIRTNLKPTLQFPDQVWRWTIHEFPVDYRDLSDTRCSEENLGRQILDLTEDLSYLIIPGKDHAEYEVKYSLTGPLGLWGKSVVLETAERDRVICASILSVDGQYEKHAVAKFSSPVAGSIHFRFLAAPEYEEFDSYVQSDLYHTRAVVEKTEFTEHKWKLFVTDVFDSDRSNHEDNCDVLQLVFDPENSGDGASVGDLDNKLGLIKVAADGSVKKFKSLFKHEVINTLRGDLAVIKRSLYVVLYDNKHSENFLACAKLRIMQPKIAKALINMDGIRGTVELTQRSPFDPTWTSFQLSASNQDYESNLRFVGSMLRYNIREFPSKLMDVDQVQTMCNTTGLLYNPSEVDMNSVPPPGMGTQDQYPVGDLLGKYKGRTEYLNHKYLLPGLAEELSGAYWDVYLPLQGIHSVMHRSLILERREPKQNVCATIMSYDYGTEYQTQMTSAEVVFRYPLVGRIVFRQPLDRPWEDTTVIVETLVHADGSNVNDSFSHRWAVHERAPGKDYYNWTARCVSAGRLLDPHAPDADPRRLTDHCRPAVEGLCRLGDLGTRHGTLTVAGRAADGARLTRRLVTDSLVALTGKHSIMKRSIVIYDDYGPVARGERMACSVINGLQRRKAVIRDWFGNGESVPVKGRIEFIQQSEYDVTNVEVTLEGLKDIRNYSIHETPVERDLDFPCERSSLYDVYNPFNVTQPFPAPTLGTADQYPLGDLGNKYGLLDDLTSYSTAYNETQLSLHGHYSILGRSVVLHKKMGSRRWACASVERGYSPGEARELRALASFHHPRGFARGYIRLTQLVHVDGSASDTVIEVNLRYPGLRDLNRTHNHNWEIFVNPVGVDATVAVTNTRCVAGGYRWNPYFTQLADPLNRELYNQECGPDNPLRCDVGDLTSRLGPISVGGSRQVLMDSNFPLEGVVSAMGRSIVIFGPERSSERFACANIEPDNDIIKYFNIMKPPSFILRSFLDAVRAVLGAPPWMVGVDARRSRSLHGGACLQLLLHFAGPHAVKLEYDFSSLMASGRLDAPSIYIPGYVDSKRKATIPYRQCELVDPLHKKKSVMVPKAAPDRIHSLLVLYCLPLIWIVFN